MPIVNIRPEHLPADIARLLTAYQEASRNAQEAHHRATSGPVAERAAHLEGAEQTALAAREALAALEAATRTGNRQILDSSASAFHAHVEAARLALATAETEMRSAAAAAALYATAQVRGGKPVLDTDTQAALRSKGKQRCMGTVSNIRDLVAELPEDID